MNIFKVLFTAELFRSTVIVIGLCKEDSSSSEKTQLTSAPESSLGLNLVLLLSTFVITSGSLLPLSAHFNTMIFSFFLPCVRTTMAQTRYFASIGPLLWNRLPSSSLCSSVLSAPLSLSLSCLTSYLLLELKCTESTFVWLMP